MRLCQQVPAMLLGLMGFVALAPTTASAQTVFEECRSPALPIPDGPGGFISDDLIFPVAVVIADLEVFLNITHTWVGDLVIQVGSPTSTTVGLHNGGGGSADNILVTYSDSGIANSPPYTCNCEMQPSGPGIMADFDDETSQGTWTLSIFDTAGADVGTLNEWCVRVSSFPEFVRGDCNDDGAYDVADAVFLLDAIFLQGSPQPPCSPACDVDGGGGLELTDSIYIIAQLFAGGPPPPLPYPTCGPDLISLLPCFEFNSCP